MRGHVGLWAGMICLGVAFLPVVIGLFWLPGDPYLPSRDRLAPPTFRHPMGTDWFGRDMLARVMLGGRSSVAIALLAVTLGGTVGLVLGGAAGYLGGLWEEAGMRLVDALLAFPAVLAALLLGAVWGPGLPGVATALALFNVPFFARIARAGFVSLKAREFVLAARGCGASDGRIIARHILPNLASPLLVQATVGLGAALLAEASLSYLRLGVQPPFPAWGRMLREAQDYLALSPWPALFPGVVLALAVLGLNLIGDAVRDLLDPAFRRLTRLRP
ncbi:MAG: hypothetical protein BIP78_0958 [Candidatus Bipolaricaulis sibiricus]|uniref:ABC transmembrane type-1 domain-containing protein n=1 Tax=Bipolaricaulis sibiricus TaxID=2501609 RepID=A0A410FUQ3_BIPS1|nr:MAG: hypothetical protein BIP78_0958 [Candidatus Bipolaricaulis sibiricus]